MLDTLMSWAAKFLGALLVFIAPIQTSVIAVSVLVLIDLVTGISASLKEKQKITSHKLRRTIAKTLAYQATILMAHLLELHFLPTVPVTKTILALIGITEGKSFFENIHRITGVDFWSKILDKLHGGVRSEDKK